MNYNNEFRLWYILRILKMKSLAFGLGYPCNEPQCKKLIAANFFQIDDIWKNSGPKTCLLGIIEDGHAYEALPTSKKKTKETVQYILSLTSKRLWN